MTMRDLVLRTALAARKASPARVVDRIASRVRERDELVDRYDGQALSFAVKEGVLEIELHREPCNEIGTTMLAELERVAAFVRSGAGGARALLFYSSISRGFSAGADLRELFRGIEARKAQASSLAWRAGFTHLALAGEVSDFLDRIHAVFDTFDEAPMTTIAAVHGVVFGGGFELALTADVVIADKTARFCFPELRLGLVPGFGGVPRLSRDLGNAVVRDLLLTGRSVGAARAYEVGLVSQLTAPGKAIEVARAVAAHSTRFDARTAKAAKRFMKRIPKRELAREKRVFLSLFASEAAIAGLRKFVESDDVMPYLP